MKINKKALYIHIPFCKQKCNYCDFLSFPFTEAEVDRYIDSLINEIRYVSKKYTNSIIASVFIGGGTPSILSFLQIKRLMDEIHQSFLVEKNGEITIEANPESLDKEKLKQLSSVCNRISIGVQTFEDSLLKGIGRIHTGQEAIERVKEAVMFSPRVNVDLMFGLPYQKMVDVEKSIEIALSLGVTHISAYSLILEETVPMASMIVPFPSEKEERAMYNYCRERLKKEGFVHYEISNFAKPAHMSKHNMTYWELGEYIGLGLGASSFVEKYRYKNTDDFEAYCMGDFSPYEKVFIDETEAKKEFMLLGLRKINGISKNEFFHVFGESVNDYFQAELEKLINWGLLKDAEGRVFLTEKGIHIANVVFMEFV